MVSTARRAAPPVIRLVALTVLALGSAVSGCSDGDGADGTPSVEAWEGIWQARQALVPERAVLEAGDQDRCGELVGTFREQMPALSPTPDDAIQSAVDDWVAHAETLVFECSNDPAVLDEQYDTLDVLTAEVDAALDAAR